MHASRSSPDPRISALAAGKASADSMAISRAASVPKRFVLSLLKALIVYLRRDELASNRRIIAKVL